MMTEKQLIERLLELQEHPGQATDQELQQALDDPQMRELVEQMAFAKRAFKHEELQGQECDVEEEWNKFAAQHFDEESDVKQQHQTSNYHGLNAIFNHHFSIFNRPKVASFIGLLVVSGIAFAAIHFVRQHQKVEAPQVADTIVVANAQHPALNAQYEVSDTIPAEPCVFNNVPLDSMLTAIAAAHGVQVEFENDAARGLRFHFVWKREDSLARIAEKLNTFDAVNIVVEDKKLIVR